MDITRKLKRLKPRYFRIYMSHGILWLPWRGDEIGYVPPWRRSPAMKDRWISICAESGFPTLTAMCCFWIGYEIAERRATRRDRGLAASGDEDTVF